MIKIYRQYTEFKRRENNDNLEEKRQRVLEIIQQVRMNGDKALLAFTKEFDHVELSSLRVPVEEIEQADQKEDSAFVSALKEAAEKIRSFHQKQKRESWFSTEEDGTILGQKVTPMDRVGIYVPGGTAAYPSSVLMNAIPAQVAGVKEIVMVTPPNRDGKVNPHVLLAAKILGIDEVYAVGGAQAVAALAYGTETIKPVDKIVGPGNIFVALAKREVFGQVGIDMIAGPSEIAIVADENANPIYLAADLLSQAEHDPMASSVLWTTSESLAEAVQLEVEKQLQQLPRERIARESIENYGGIIVVESLEEAFKQVNQMAPEHLEVMVEQPFAWLPKIKHAGAIFLGTYSSEPVGDYFAGPNHVLPTSGTARFSSPLNVDDFIKKSSIIAYSKEALFEHGKKIITLAEKEGLHAHGKAIAVRLEGER
ncbi:histidinol dehydrogenase [Tepidibacillus fermentans]|uniref:Histidinol dehydrogenase n=1 Tax=Tepidibacillus fermentans TaxID=1281767 RepID=A0A4R3KFH6_9BACI|nr:histidinol dehydrogenase [Tepidibacillus fermentans]TCS81803.1 histidinol dehydrogenase [Tepidibacillus fermentans]